MQELLTYLARIAVIFTLAYWAVRVSGKKTISAMTPTDLLAVTLIAAMVAMPLVSASALKTVYGIAMVVVIQVLFGLLSLWNPVRALVQPQPLVLIYQGQVDRRALRTAQIPLEMLLSELRVKGYATITDVDYAILEPSGKISVIPNTAARPVTVRDMKLPQQQLCPSGVALPLVLDGQVMRENLRYAGVDEDWLRRELAQQGHGGPGEIFLAELDPQGKLTVQPQGPVQAELYPEKPGQRQH